MCSDYSFDTRLIVNEQKENEVEAGAVNKPIYQSSAFAYSSAEELADVFQGRRGGYTYSRLSNPTTASLEAKMNSLEEGRGAVSCSSGMAAVATTLLSLVEAGDRIIAGSGLFGGTYNFLTEELQHWGLETTFVSPREVDQFERHLDEETRLIFLETLGNPGLEIPDIEKIAVLSHRYNLPLIVDNTLLSPYLFRPGESGADVVIYSTSKYVNGHASAIGGMIIDTGNFSWSRAGIPALSGYEKYGSRAFLARLRKSTHRNLGGCSAPFNSFLTELGLGTLALRMERHCENANELAHYLQKRPGVKKVNYPGLTSHPDHKLARASFQNKFGGLLTFELQDRRQCFRLLDELELAENLANLGDIRTLVIHPESTIYCNITEREQRQLGVTPGLIRVSTGLEDSKDIVADFARALDQL